MCESGCLREFFIGCRRESVCIRGCVVVIVVVVVVAGTCGSCCFFLRGEGPQRPRMEPEQGLVTSTGDRARAVVVDVVVVVRRSVRAKGSKWHRRWTHRRAGRGGVRGERGQPQGTG